MGLTRGAGPFLDEASHAEDFATNFPLLVRPADAIPRPNCEKKGSHCHCYCYEYCGFCSNDSFYYDDEYQDYRYHDSGQRCNDDADDDDDDDDEDDGSGCDCYSDSIFELRRHPRQ